MILHTEILLEEEGFTMIFFRADAILASSIWKVRTGTYLGLEPCFPKLKCRKIRELIEMHLRDLIPLLFNNAN